MMKFLHRDDLPYQIIEEFERQLGVKVVCPGDLPEEEIPEEVLQIKAMMDAQFEASVREGRCVECSFPIPDYQNLTKTPKGWGRFMDLEGTIQGWHCPSCSREMRGG
jgi:hypothetical protein